MTEPAAATGSATALVAPNAGTPAAAPGATDPGSNGGAADPFAGLETGARDWVGTKGYKTNGDVVSALQNAESLIGKSIQLPGADAKPEDWDKVYDRLGRPKDAAYEFKLPEGLPETFAYDGERAKAFKSVAHKAGLTQKQAAIIHDEETKANAAAFAKVAETVTANAAAATQTLEKAWGPKDSDGFKQGVNLAVRAIEGLDKVPGVAGLQKALEGAGLLVGGVVVDPTIALALAHVGKALFKEDTLETGGSAAGENPFTDGGNMTVQMQMIANDKARALRLISAAGKKPTDFGLT